MTDQELNMWERQDDVSKVLTSKEFGAWLYRRDENKQKKGKWIPRPDEYICIYTCSECGAVGHRTAFCPHCGAKMEE